MNAPAQDFKSNQLRLFAVRCTELSDRVFAGELGFIDAVDMAYTAAVLAGLVESIGDDAVQKVMAAAFIVDTLAGGAMKLSEEWEAIDRLYSMLRPSRSTCGPTKLTPSRA